MGEKKQKSGISIGSTMLVLIFGIVTLTTFAVLAVVSANADWKLAQKNKEMVSSYYMADAAAEERLLEIDSRLADLRGSTGGEQAYFEQVSLAFGDLFDPEKNELSFYQELNDNIRLSVVLKLEYLSAQEGHYQIRAWNTESYGDYQIDNSMSVWKGEELK